MAFKHILGVIFASIFFISNIMFVVFFFLYVYAKVKKQPKSNIKKRKIATLICLVACLMLFFILPVFTMRMESTSMMARKPIIYLYPEKETDISVKLGLPKQIAHSYPKYTTGWKVHAEPDGTLTDSETGRELYSLYYESECVEPYKQTNEGFCIAGKDTICFLEEKLSILGLNEREAEEFIIYWLPKLESNEYNYIRFATKEEIDKNMPLDIQPKPDTTIRVMMIYKGLGEPINVQEQKLRPVERRGYTAVEWGGTFPG